MLGRLILLGSCLVAATSGHALERQIHQTISPESRRGIISGTVVAMDTGVPLAGAVVYLNQRGQRGQSQLTDDRGRFAFVELPAGEYLLRVTKGGFIDAELTPLVMGTNSGQIALAPGQWFDRANVSMHRVAAIGGRIADERGEPLVGAYVRVARILYIAQRRHYVLGPVTQTDDRGEYRIFGLSPGTYVVFTPSVQHSAPAGDRNALLSKGSRTAVENSGAGAPSLAALLEKDTALLVGSYLQASPTQDGRRRVYPITFYPGARTPEAAQPIELSPGAQANADLFIRPVPVATVSGWLVGSSSFAGVVLRLLLVGFENSGIGSEVATSHVSPDGSFTFLNVPSGEYILVAPGTSFEYAFGPTGGAQNISLPETPGVSRTGGGSRGGSVSFAPDVFRNAAAPDSIADDHAGYVRLPLTVAESDILNLRVPLQSTGSVRLSVHYEDFAGDPPIGSLELAGASPETPLGLRLIVLRRPTEADPIPLYVARVLLPGSYAIRLVGMSTAAIKSIRQNGEDYTAKPIFISGGQVEAVDVTVTGKAAQIEGTARHSDGSTAAGSTIIVFPVDQALWSDYGLTPTWIRATVANTNGSFRLSGLRAGDYYLVATGPQQTTAWSDPAFLEKAAHVAQRLSLRWGSQLRADPVVWQH